MKKRKKFLERILSLVLAVVMVAGLVFSPTGVASASGTQDEAAAEQTADPTSANVTAETEPAAAPAPTVEPTPTAEPTVEPTMEPTQEPAVEAQKETLDVVPVTENETNSPAEPTVEPTVEPEPSVEPTPSEVPVEPTPSEVPAEPMDPIGITEADLKVSTTVEGNPDLNKDQSVDIVRDSSGYVTVYVKFDAYSGLSDVNAVVVSDSVVCTADALTEAENGFYRLRFKAEPSMSSQEFEVALRGTLENRGTDVPVSGTKEFKLRVLDDKALQLAFSAEGRQLVYGQGQETITVTGVEGRTLQVVSSSDAVSAAPDTNGDTISIKINKPTDENVVLTITAEASAESQYSTTSIQYPIGTVAKKNIVLTENIDNVDAGTREYRPGDKTVSAAANLSGHPDVVSGDQVEIQIKGEIQGSGDASENPYTWSCTNPRDPANVTLSGDNAEKYTLTVGESVQIGGTVKVSKAQVYPVVKVKSEEGQAEGAVPEVAYGNWDELLSMYEIEYHFASDGTLAEEMDGVLDAKQFLAVVDEVYPQYNNQNEVQEQQAVYVNYSAYDEKELDNYHVEDHANAVDFGSARITWKNDADHAVAFDTENSQKIFVLNQGEENEELVVNGGSLLAVKKTNAQDDTFDTICYRWNEEEAWAPYDVTPDQGTQTRIGVLEENADKNLQVYLAKEDSDGNLQKVSDVFSMEFKSDVHAPHASVNVVAHTSNGELHVSSENEPEISEDFDTYSYADQNLVKVEIQPSDEVADEKLQNEVATGVAQVAYKVIPAAAETSLETINSSAVNEDGYISITDPEEDGTYTFEIKNEDGVDSGSYIFLIRIKDNIGNFVVYTSDGAILETVMPEMNAIEISGTGNGEVYDSRSPINVTLSAQEKSGEGIQSGIQRIEYRLIVDGKELTEEAVVIENTAEIGQNEAFYGTFDLSQKYDVKDGNVVEIQATAYDYAGNQSNNTVSRTIRIDSAEPEITDIALVQKEAPAGSVPGDVDDAAERIPYINDENGAQISFKVTERNLKNAAAVLNYNNQDYTVNITKGADGSWTAKADAGEVLKNIGLTAETEGIETQFTLSLKDEGYYRVVSVSAEDILASVSGETEGEKSHVSMANPEQDISFVYDVTAPVLTRAYYQYADGKQGDLKLEGSDEILYIGENGEHPALVFEIEETNAWSDAQAAEFVKNVVSKVTNLDGTKAETEGVYDQQITDTESGIIIQLSNIPAGRYDIQLKAEDFAGNSLGYKADASDESSFVPYEDGFPYCIEINDKQPEVTTIEYTGTLSGNEADEYGEKRGYYGNEDLSAAVTWAADYLTSAEIRFLVRDYQGDAALDPVVYTASWNANPAGSESDWEISSSPEMADADAVEVAWQSATGTYTEYKAGITFKDPGEEKDREIVILSVLAGDKYGMDGSKTDGFENVIIDNTKPEVAVTHNYVNESGVALPDAYYNPGATEVTISIHERYFDDSLFTYAVSRTENPQASENAEDYDVSERITEEAWDEATNTWHITFTLPEDGKYTVNAEYTDYVKNTSSHQDELIVDQTVPTGKITITGDRTAEGYGERTWTESWTQMLIEKITFGLFSKVDTSVTLEASDLTAGVRTIEYLKDVYEVKENEDGSTSAQGKVDADSDGKVTPQDIENAVLENNGQLEWTRCETTSVNFSVNPDEQYVVYAKVTDYAGNVWYLSSDGVIVDNEAPTDSEGNDGPQITVNTMAAKNIYNGDVELSVSVEDPVNGTYSGIERVWYVVRAAGNVSKISDEVTLTPANDGQTDEQGNRTRSYTFYVFEQGGLDINEYNSNDVTVVVYAQDYSGNISSNYVNFAVDTTNPEIEVKYDGPAMPQHDFYYSQPRTATFTITERNLDYADITDLVFYIQRENDGEAGEYGIVADGNRLYLANAAGDELEGISVSVEDSQADRVLTPKQLSDDRTTTVKLTFNKDDAYTVSAKITDRAYNTPASTAAEHFVIDNTDPVMQVSYYTVDSNGNNVEDITDEVKAGRVYRNQTIRSEITINEHNFMLGSSVEGMDVQVRVARNTADIADYHNLAQTSSWESNGDIRKLSYTFTLDGEYVQSVTYTDLSGRVVSDREAQFNVDKTQPNGQIRIAQHEGWSWSSLLSAVTFGLFDQNSVTVNMNADDYTSPLQEIEYARFPQMKTLDQLEEYNGWSSDGNSAAEFEKASSYGVETNEQFIAYEKLTDYAGNVRYISSNGVVLDNTQPAPKITITNLSQASNGIFNEDVVLQIDVEDPTVGDTYAGLERIWYTVSAVGNVNTSNTITLMDNSSNRVQSHKTWSGTVTIPADVYNSNDVTVTAYARDFAGNESHTEEKLKIDSTIPSISVSYDLNSPLNGQYYKDTRTATVTVTDRNFDPNNVHFTITNTDGTSASISGWSSSSNAGVSDSATHTATVSFAADGDYTFTLNCTDLAGNSTEYGQTDTFTIDKTIPEISVSYDNNDARISGYFKEQRTATISIHEHNFNAADVQAQITAQLQGQGIGAPSVGRFSNSGDVHTATVTYAADGDYTFDIGYTDMAGNVAEEYTPDQFTIDLTAPEVEIIDIQDKSANNGVVSPGFTYTDVNYDTENVTVTLTGANNGTVTVGAVEEAIANGERVKLNDFAYTEDMDDLYTLQVKVGDKAGNETEKSVMFSVNRFGSVYVLDEDTRQWLSTDEDNYTYINEERPVGIIEYNVDDLEVSRITSDRDGDLQDLVSGTDYTVKKSGNDVQWKEYYYQIDASNFEEEGNYTLTLYSEDRANNTTNNTSLKHEGRELPLEFTVDKTAPTVVVSGVENEGQYRSAERTMTIDAKDNLMLSEVTVDANGEKTTYDARTLAENDGVISVDLRQSNQWQTIRVTAKDAAGNILGSEEERTENGVVLTADGLMVTVLITPNIMVQYYMNKPLFFGSIAVVVVIIAIIVVILVRRRKQEETQR